VDGELTEFFFVNTHVDRHNLDLQQFFCKICTNDHSRMQESQCEAELFGALTSPPFYSRAGTPLSAMWRLTAAMGTSRRWKIPAASAADALVREKTSVKCSGAPAPLDAMTGMVTALETASTRPMSKPFVLCLCFVLGIVCC
jgi:hypothetical protein